MKSRRRDSRALRWIKIKIVTARDWCDDEESEVSRTLKPKIGLGAAGKRLNHMAQLIKVAKRRAEKAKTRAVSAGLVIERVASGTGQDDVSASLETAYWCIEVWVGQYIGTSVHARGAALVHGHAGVLGPGRGVCACVRREDKKSITWVVRRRPTLYY